jgi:DnaJ-class molecular chaperone
MVVKLKKDTAYVCPKCAGLRKLDGKECPTCAGAGVVYKTYEAKTGDSFTK